MVFDFLNACLFSCPTHIGPSGGGIMGTQIGGSGLLSQQKGIFNQSPPKNTFPLQNQNQQQQQGGTFLNGLQQPSVTPLQQPLNLIQPQQAQQTQQQGTGLFQTQNLLQQQPTATTNLFPQSTQQQGNPLISRSLVHPLLHTAGRGPC